MRKLSNQEKCEATHMLAMLVALIRLIEHMIIEAQKNTKWMQKYSIRTTLMINMLRSANEMIHRVAYRFCYYTYHQIDNTHVYSVKYEDIMCKRSSSDVYQYFYRLNMDSFDDKVNKLAEEIYPYITGGED